MAKVGFKRIINSANIGEIPIIDGQLIYTKDGKQYIDYEEARIDLTSERGVILWENSAPNDLMPSATAITLLSSDYDILECFYKVSNSSNDIQSTKTIKGYNMNMSAIGDQGIGLKRVLTYNTDTSYTIEQYSGEYVSDSGAGKYIIPLYIVGYKTNLF